MSNFARRIRRSSGTTSRQRARDLIAARLERQRAHPPIADRLAQARASPAPPSWSIGGVPVEMDDDLKVDLKIRSYPVPGAWPSPKPDVE